VSLIRYIQYADIPLPFPLKEILDKYKCKQGSDCFYSWVPVFQFISYILLINIYRLFGAQKTNLEVLILLNSQCYKCEGLENEYMFYYKGKLYPLLSSHPDIQKAWKAWDDIIFFWEKSSKNGILQSAENFHKTNQEATVYDSDLKSTEYHQAQPDSVSIKNSGLTKSEETQEMDYRQGTVNSDLK